MTKNIKPIFMAIILLGVALYLVDNFREINRFAQKSIDSVDVSNIKIKTANLELIDLPRIEDFQEN